MVISDDVGGAEYRVSRPVPYRRAPLMGPTGPGLDRVRTAAGQPVPTARRSALPAAQPLYAHCPDLPVPLEVPGLTYRDALRSDRCRSRNRRADLESRGVDASVRRDIRAANRIRACCAGAPRPRRAPVREVMGFATALVRQTGVPPLDR